MFEIVTVIIVTVLIFVVVGSFFYLYLAIKNLQADFKTLQQNPILTMMQTQIDALRNQISENTIQQNNIITQNLKEVVAHILNAERGFSQKLESSSTIFSDVRHRLGELSKSIEQIQQIGKEFLELQILFKTPKIRGGFGEVMLEDFLKQSLPSENYKTQFQFKTGVKVDAIIRIGYGLVPIDAKFPMSNFQKFVTSENEKERENFRKKFMEDLKKHIDTISSKYINPQEGTYDFALLYIPAENIYYEVIVKDDILDYALEKNVIPVSPNTFFAYLQTIVFGMRGFRIEEKAKLILQHLNGLKFTFEDLKNDFKTLGTHLRDARNKYDDVDRKINLFEDRLIVPQTETPDVKSLP